MRERDRETDRQRDRKRERESRFSTQIMYFMHCISMEPKCELHVMMTVQLEHTVA